MEIINIHFMGQEIPIAVHSKSDAITGQLRTFGTFFEVHFLNFLRHHICNQKNIIDIGANIGNHSVFFDKFLNCDKIYCFEPEPENLKLLRYNMKDAVQTGKCEIFDVALSNAIGELPFYNTDPGNFGGFGLENFNFPDCKSYLVNEKITVKPLDDYQFKNVSLIKMDIEGHELKALSGATQTIINNQPVVFVEELHHGYPHRFGKTDYKSFFTPLNYECNHVNIGGSYMDMWAPK
jgi:FkbM family methyltransferase